jgi:hypothetical protein
MCLNLALMAVLTSQSPAPPQGLPPIPDTRIVLAPPPLEISSGARFTFEATPPDDAAFECSLDNAPFIRCPANGRFTSLAPGFHVLQVRAINSGGIDASPAWHEWTSELPDVDVFTGYSIVGHSQTGRFPVGWTAGLGMSITDSLQAVAEASGDYVDQHSGGTSDHVTRYWLQSGARLVARSTHASLFAQGLVGVVRGPDESLGSDRASYDPALEAGGGLDLNVNPYVALRFGAGARLVYRESDRRWEWRFTNGLVWRFTRRE